MIRIRFSNHFHGHGCLNSGTWACKRLWKNGLSRAQEVSVWNCDRMYNTSWHLLTLKQLTLRCIIRMWQWQQLGYEKFGHVNWRIGFRFRAQEQCAESFMKGVSMAEQLHPGRTSPSSMQSVRWSGEMYAATGLWRPGEAFSGVTNHVSGNLMDESGFGGCQELYTSDPVVPSVKFGGVVSFPWFQWKDLRILQHTKTFWIVPSSKLCGNSLDLAPSSSNMTVNQRTNQGPFSSNIIVWPHKYASERMVKSSHTHS